jgi:hypothetical protein
LTSLELDVFGTRVRAVRDEGRWSLFYLGADGKKRPATDLLVPDSVTESELEGYLADLCHEWASETHPEVTRLE